MFIKPNGLINNRLVVLELNQLTFVALSWDRVQHLSVCVVTWNVNCIFSLFSCLSVSWDISQVYPRSMRKCDIAVILCPLSTFIPPCMKCVTQKIKIYIYIYIYVSEFICLSFCLSIPMFHIRKYWTNFV